MSRARDTDSQPPPRAEQRREARHEGGTIGCDIPPKVLAANVTPDPLPSIVDFFVHDDPDCPWCEGEGIVCEDHPGTAWTLAHDEVCGAAGMPCPRVPG